MTVCYKEDAQLLIKWVEATHPIFHLDEVPSDYIQIRDTFLEKTGHPMTKWPFLFETMKYLAKLNDGHMGHGYGIIDYNSPVIDIETVYSENKLYMSDNGMPGDEIISINDVLIIKIMDAINELTYAENMSMRKLQYERMCRIPQILEYADCKSEKSVNITLCGTNGEYVQEFPVVPPDQLTSKRKKADYIIQCETRGDIFIIDLREFKPHQSIDDTCVEIKKAMESGITKFIFDIRGNGGGNSNVGQTLLSAMGMKTPQYGLYEIGSDYIVGRLNGKIPENRIRHYEPDLNCAVRNDDISLVVLNDHYTFSSATMFSVWVQDGKLGKIIGTPSSNSPNAYGEMSTFMLPLSGQYISISRKKFLRPDVNADPHVLHPDILIEPNEDAMERAIGYLCGK